MSASAGVADAATDDIFKNIKTGLPKTTEEVCGTNRPHRWRLGTWWWNEHVEKATAAKRKVFKAWKTNKSTGALYMQSYALLDMLCSMLDKRPTRRFYGNIDPKFSEVYRLANQF